VANARPQPSRGHRPDRSGSGGQVGHSAPGAIFPRARHVRTVAWQPLRQLGRPRQTVATRIDEYNTVRRTSSVASRRPPLGAASV
jgi:hypothetical protein